MNVTRGAKRTMSIARAREVLENSLVDGVRELAVIAKTADKPETRLRAIELIMANTLGRPAAQTTNINLTVSNAASQLEALRALTVQAGPTIDHNPLETLDDPASSRKELVKSQPETSLSALTSAVVSPDSARAATPPASPSDGGEF